MTYDDDDDEDLGLDPDFDPRPFYKYGLGGTAGRRAEEAFYDAAGLDAASLFGGGAGNAPDGGAFGSEDATPQRIANVTFDLPYFQNGLVKARVSWSRPSDPNTDKVILHWTPDVCIADDTVDSAITKTVTATTREHHFEIFDLRFDCR